MHTLLLILLAFSTSLAAGPLDFTVFGPRLGADYRLDLSSFLPADRLRIADLEGIGTGRSYDEFLDELKKARPGLFEQAVFIHDSGSLQLADREHPRVILFGDGLMLAFAEDPRVRERSVEVIGFNGTDFDFAELKFSEKGGVYQASPRNCQSCHGVNGKPLWDPYDFWPNAYGSAIARFKTDAEKKAYEGLRGQTGKTGIYARVRWPASPANNNNGMDGIESFTQYVTQLQIFAKLQSWQQSKDFQAMVPALLAVLNQCAAIDDDKAAARQLAGFFPEGWRSGIESGFPGFHEKVKAERKRLIAYQVARYQSLFPGGKTLFPMNHERLSGETLTTAQLFYVLSLAGLETRDFALSQGLNAFMLSVPSNLDFDLATDFSLVAQDLFQTFKPSLMNGGGYGYTWAVFDCRDLQAESLARLQTIKPVAQSAGFQAAPTVFGECISCHSIDSAARGIPAIPFDRTAALREYLRADDKAGLARILDRVSRKGAGQMPPYRALKAGEREQLEINLRLLSE